MHDELTDFVKSFPIGRKFTSQDTKRNTILGLCTVAEVDGITPEQRTALMTGLRAAMTNRTTDQTMDHDGGVTGNPSSFEHLSCAFETAVLRAFETAGIPDVRGRMVTRRGNGVIQSDDQVQALVWLDGLLQNQGTSMDNLTRREVILYRNNIRWRLINQDNSATWMREHLWRTVSKTILYIECRPGE